MRIASTILVQEDLTWVDGQCSETRNTPGDLADVLPVGEKWFEVTREGVILLDAPVHDRMGFPAKHPANTRGLDAFLVPARAAGWNVSRPSPWMTFYAPGRPSIHIGLLGWLGTTNHALYVADDPGAMTYRMRRYHETLGSAFHGTPGISGTGLLRDHYRGRSPRWVGTFQGIAAADVETEARYVWKSPTHLPPLHAFSHTYDANLQYLGAANVTEVALDDLKHTGRREFTAKAAGYWKIIVPVWNDTRMPHPANAPVGKEKWVTTPTMQLLEQLADQGDTVMPEVLDSWTCDRTARVFRAWAEKISKGLDAVTNEPMSADQDALTVAIKRTYRETIGMSIRPGGRIYRPDWHHAVVGMARCNLFRRLRAAAAAGHFPEEINVDAVTWGSDNPDPIAAAPAALAGRFRPGPGGWKVQETVQHAVVGA